jgi:hypothetical protein
MILHSFRKHVAIHRFDRMHHHSSFPAKSKASIAPNFGSTPPLGHRLAAQSAGLRDCASLQRELRTSARFWRVRTTLCLVAHVTLSAVSFSFIASAEKSTANVTAGSNTLATYSRNASACQRIGFAPSCSWRATTTQSLGRQKSAIGLMQIMPQTYAELRLRYHLGTDPYVPRSNILAGAAYLREMHDRYGPAGFLAAYNAGPARYEDYLARGRPLPEETRNYVATLAPIMGVPALPHHPESTPVPSQSVPFVAAHDQGSRSTAISENRFSPRMTPFENRRSAQAGLLFAALHDAFEQPSASAHSVDKTALEPSPNRTLSAIPASGEHQRERVSKTAQSPFEPSGNALFAVRSDHFSK